MNNFCFIKRGEIDLWNNINELQKLINQIDSFFTNFPEIFKETMILSIEIKNILLKIDPFIDHNARKICSHCTNICCQHKNSRYEYDDTIYILALREKFPLSDRNLKEKEPCYLLTEKGCKTPRYLRPLRCNWYLCENLLKEMESAPARVFREFSNNFKNMLYIREQMLNSFFKSLSYLKGNI